MSDDINIKYKDTIFRYLFKESKNFIPLYEELSGKKLKEKDIKFYDTSSNILTKDLKNDVSFLTSDNKLIIMVEHQATVNKNMAIRSLLYYSEIIKNYIKENKLNVFSSVPIDIPSAEMYVAYNGTRSQEDEILEIGENFTLDTGTVKVSVNVQNINYDHIKTKGEKNNFVGYTYFIDRIRKFEKDGSETVEAIDKARNECLNKGLLTEYLNRKEFLTMATEVYTIEEQIKDARLDGIQEGMQKAAKKTELEMNLQFIKNAHEQGCNPEEISKLTKLPLEKVEEFMGKLGLENQDNSQGMNM